jgi:hypothetical protein
VLRNGFVAQEMLHFSKLLPGEKPMESMIESETKKMYLKIWILKSYFSYHLF